MKSVTVTSLPTPRTKETAPASLAVQRAGRGDSARHLQILKEAVRAATIDGAASESGGPLARAPFEKSDVVP